ncbi:MAG: UDP-N-acetylmuramoyl-L-alanine--D-glutamate ligase, partial [Vicinamibacterales bacterium]|nr:UDP-N-acetylmuramoyl-L-alanine--D-glutamate ligase [Vicinamibacterales bacterium]
GAAAARLLAGRGARVTLTDLRPAIDDADGLRQAGVDLVLGENPAALFAAADLVVLSPGVPPVQPAFDAARDRGIPIIGEVELASRWLRGRIVAITGTKGKSTTTALTARILTGAGFHAPAGGNLGPALSGQVAASTPESIHVVEVSSFQLETTVTFHPWIAVLLNLSPDHLDRHADVDEYARAKTRIFANQTEQDWAVINADDAATLALARHGRARQARFSLDSRSGARVTVANDWVVERSADGEVPIVPTSAVRLMGPHLLADVLAAATVARIAGIAPSAIAEAVSSFNGLEHAMEYVDDVRGVRFVNDSKATNIEAARQSIETFSGRLAVIMGGRFKGGDLGVLRGPLAGRSATVVAIGDARPLLHAAFDGVVPVVDAASMADAVRTAFAAVAGGGHVLLAPACASFDMFENYAARGAAFRSEVARLRRDLEGVERV